MGILSALASIGKKIFSVGKRVIGNVVGYVGKHGKKIFTTLMNAANHPIGKQVINFATEAIAKKVAQNKEERENKAALEEANKAAAYEAEAMADQAAAQDAADQAAQAQSPKKIGFPNPYAKPKIAVPNPSAQPGFLGGDGGKAYAEWKAWSKTPASQPTKVIAPLPESNAQVTYKSIMNDKTGAAFIEQKTFGKHMTVPTYGDQGGAYEYFQREHKRKLETNANRYVDPQDKANSVPQAIEKPYVTQQPVVVQDTPMANAMLDGESQAQGNRMARTLLAR